jgi:hypothetical protein
MAERSRLRIPAHSAAPAVLCFYTMALGVFAYALQELFYSRFAGFYDSMSYYGTLAHTHALVDRSGPFGALAAASRHSTVFLPWLEAVLIHPFVPVRRWVGIVIQLPWILLFALVTYAYHRTIGGSARRLAVVLAVTSIGFAGMYNYNGGLPDFRMDLLQAVFFGTIATWFLLARQTGTMVAWAVLGVLIGLGCLTRATLPLHLLLFFLPVAAVDLVIASRGRWTLAGRYAIAVAVGLAISGPFYLVNFDHLYYYYVIWNTDANAGLPVAESFRHVYFALEHIGNFLIAGLLAFAAMRVAAVWRRGARLNWRALWAGIAPLAYLVLSGSGLNPFVGMVAVPGIVLFLACPLIPPRPEGDASSARAPGRWPLLAPLGAMVLGCALILTAIGGVTRTVSGVSPWIPEAAGIEAVAEAILANLPQVAGDPARTNVAVSFSGGTSFGSIGDVLVYSKGYEAVQPHCSALWGHTICAVKLAPVAQAEWDELAGRSEDEKLCTIAMEANAKVDILIVPSSGMELHGLLINGLQEELKALLYQEGRWREIARDIRINDGEKVDILLNVGRTRQTGDSGPRPVPNREGDCRHP